MLMTMGWWRRVGVPVFGALVGILCLGGSVHAQSAIAGQVTDATGAVLPGVTVEAASPALIEGTRTAVDRQPGSLRDRGAAPRHLQSHLHDAGLLDADSRRGRAGLELHGAHQRTVEARRARGIAHRLRAVAARRRSADDVAAGADPRCPRCAPDRSKQLGGRHDAPRGDEPHRPPAERSPTSAGWAVDNRRIWWCTDRKWPTRASRSTAWTSTAASAPATTRASTSTTARSRK